MPAASRSPAQIEAARRNGAGSRGPRTEEGKARSRLNALRHGLAAKRHTLLETEDPAAWDELVAGLVEEHAPGTETEARLVLRLASALWRQERADRMEHSLFVAAPRPEFRTAAGGVVYAAPEETFELARLDAIRRYRADASREAFRIVRELRQLRQSQPAEAQNEPEPPTGEGGTTPENEPGPPARGAHRTTAIMAPAWPTPPVPEPGNRNEPDEDAPAEAHFGLAGSLATLDPRSGRG